MVATIFVSHVCDHPAHVVGNGSKQIDIDEGNLGISGSSASASKSRGAIGGAGNDEHGGMGWSKRNRVVGGGVDSSVEKGNDRACS